MSRWPGSTAPPARCAIGSPRSATCAPDHGRCGSSSCTRAISATPAHSTNRSAWSDCAIDAGPEGRTAVTNETAPAVATGAFAMLHRLVTGPALGALLTACTTTAREGAFSYAAVTTPQATAALAP